MKKMTIVYIITAIFIILFFYTGISKMLNYSEYISELDQSPVLKYLPRSLAWAIPASEFGIALLLLNKNLRLIGLYASFTLMLLFLVYVIILSQFPYYVPCDCGGVLSALPINVHIAINLFLTALTLVGIYIEKNIAQYQPGPS